MERDREMPNRVARILSQIVPMCQDLTVDEQAWVTSACLRYLVMKIEDSQ